MPSRARGKGRSQGGGLVDLLLVGALVVSMERWRARRLDRRTAPGGGTPDEGRDASDDAEPGRAAKLLARVDRIQRRSRPLGFAYGVVKKFGDDRAGRLAALIAYYAFFSVFPLMLVLVTVLRFVLEGEPELRDDLLASAAVQIPVVGPELADAGVGGNLVALLTGTAGALWAGMGALLAAQDAMNAVWDVPMKDRPNFVKSRVRGLLLLALVGSALVATTAVQGIGSAVDGIPGVVRLAVPLAVLAVDVVLMALVFRVLPASSPPMRALWPGAVLGGAGYWAIQLGGTWYFQRVVAGASDTYGTFAVVIGLLSWFYLLGQVILFAAEVNVVAHRGLWPRSLNGPDLTVADLAAAEARAEETRRSDGVRLEVSRRQA